MVTTEGAEFSTGQAVLYAILLIMTAILLVISIMATVRMDGSQVYDVGGGILKVNYKKYTKIGLFMLSFILLDMLMYLSWQTADKFLQLTFFTGILKVVWIFLTIGFFPAFFISIYLMAAKWLMDVQWEKLLKRRLKPRN